ncbi:MAG: Flp pilus assembly complex ATPase component TadA [Bacteriovoracaceae bacterium]|jgi:type IV secretion system protein VirB11|nr:Flp pilus assembly complex ATPase component TadA [Bacteriovoracaceae bacterium]
MSNLNIFNKNLNNEVLQYFKNIYKQNITKKRILGFKEIRDITSDELGMNLVSHEQSRILEAWFHDINSLMYLEDLFSNCFEEIIIHSPKLVQVYQSGNISSTHLSISMEEIFLSIEVLTLKERKNWNQGIPFVSFNSIIHKKSCRITVVHPATHGSRKGFKVFIRAIGNQIIPLRSFVRNESMSTIIKELINKKENLLISGSTGSGKTSLLTSLLSMIDEEHVIILEDTQEINVKKDHFTYLLAAESKFYSLEKYTQYSLRMRPERIILGEMRGSEVIPFMLAMNNGHKGLMSSIHSINARDGVERIALLFEMSIQNKSLSYSEVLKLISQNINYVIHMENKKITEIIKVFGSDGERINFEYIYSENKYPCSEYKAR